MGGIGLELRKLQQRPSYLTVLRVFAYSLALSVGPWLATIFAVGLVSFIGLKKSGLPDMTFFTSTIMYVFAGSLIVTGPLFMVFSRYLADRAFLGQRDQRSALVAVQLVLMPLFLALGLGGAHYFVPASLGNTALYRSSTALLFASVSGLWCVLAFLDFQKRFAVSFYVFATGCLVSVGAAYFLRSYGRDGLLAGYTAGTVTSFLTLLFISLRREKPAALAGPSFNLRFLLSYLRAFAALALVGLFYNVGTWIDKIVMWAMKGEQVAGSRFWIFAPYDIATFLAYLIMMPAVSYFLVMVETEFYLDYRSYLNALETSPLQVVEEKRHLLWQNLKRHMNSVFELELVVGVLGLFLGNAILNHFGMDQATIKTFRILIGAAFLQVLISANSSSPR